MQTQLRRQGARIKSSQKYLGLALVCAFALGNQAQSAPPRSELNDAIKLYQAKNYPKAKESFDKVVKAKPEEWQAHYYLGNIYLAMGQLPQAKYCYQVCLHYCRDASGIAQCQTGLDAIAKYVPQKPAAVASTPSGSGSKDTPKSDTEDDDDEPKADSNSPQARAQKAREEIMNKAKAEVSAIRKAAHEQIESEIANSNRMYRYSDGTRELNISQAQKDAINAEAEEKCTKIMNEAEARCRGYR